MHILGVNNPGQISCRYHLVGINGPFSFFVIIGLYRAKLALCTSQWRQQLLVLMPYKPTKKGHDLQRGSVFLNLSVEE